MSSSNPENNPNELYLLGGTGGYGALTVAPGQHDTLVRRETFADAKAYVINLANEWISFLAQQHDLHARLAPGGQHPSMNVEPPVKVHLTDDYLVCVIEIIVNLEFEDGTRNKFFDRRFAAGWVRS